MEPPARSWLTLVAEVWLTVLAMSSRCVCPLVRGHEEGPLSPRHLEADGRMRIVGDGRAGPECGRDARDRAVRRDGGESGREGPVGNGLEHGADQPEPDRPREAGRDEERGRGLVE